MWELKDWFPLVLSKPMYGMKFHFYEIQKQAKVIVDAFGRERLIGKGSKGMFGVIENFCIQKKTTLCLGSQEILMHDQI